MPFEFALHMNARRTWLMQVAAMALAFFVASVAAILLTRLSGGIALFWISNAVLLTLLHPVSPRRWVLPVIAAYVASVAASLLVGPMGSTAFVLAAANVGEAVLAAVIMRRWQIDRQPFSSLPSVLKFVAGSAVFAPMLAGCVGAMAASAALGLSFLSTWTDWIIGHGLGMLIATPVFVLMADREVRQRLVRSRTGGGIELTALLMLVALATVITFSQEALPLLFFPLLPIVLAAFRMGRIGAATSLIVLALIGSFCTVNGHGPVMLIDGSSAMRFQFFQFYIAANFLIALPVAAELNQRKQLTRLLAESEARFRFLAENSGDAMLNISTDGLIRYASPSVQALAGLDADTIVGTPALDIIDPRDHDRVQFSHRRALVHPGETVTVEYRARTASGSDRWFESNSRAVVGDDGVLIGVVSAIRDISERKQLEALLAEAALTDSLTGLGNRRAFELKLSEAMARRGQSRAGACLALFDLDFFKRVNDFHGHDGGDAVLQAIGAICRRTLREGDMIARVGGEEFAVLFENTPVAVARSICERLRHAIETEPVRVPSRQLVHVTASIGITQVDFSLTGDEVMRAADRALYAAKSSGRNRLCLAA